MTTTAADWVTEAEQHLNSGSRESRNKLAVALTDTTGTTVSFTYGLGTIQEGSVIAVDLEVMHVWSVDPTGNTAVVERGQYGSTAATHLIGATVFVNPKWPKFAIFRALNQELQSLASAGLFKMTAVERTYSPVVSGYDLTGVTNLEGIYAVEAKIVGLTGDWVRIPHYDLRRDQNTTDFPSGFSLTLREGGMPGQAVRVLYKSRFTALSALTTDVSTTNLPSSAYDLPPLGAAARLVTPREVGRNDTSTQGDTRRAEEVPAGAVARSGAYLWQLRRDRLAEELTELRRLYPYRSTV